MGRATKDFINELTFSCFETYSFQRKGAYEAINQLSNKRIQHQSLSADDRKEYDVLLKSIGNSQNSARILSKSKELHESAELVATVQAGSEAAYRLIEIL